MDARRPENNALARVAAYVQAGGAGREMVGPFAVALTPNTTHPMMNYAVPIPDAEPTDAEIAGLVEAFTSRGLLPRLEYLPGTAPAVEPALRNAGFTEERRPLVMVCDQVTEIAAPHGVTLGLASRDQYAEIAGVQHKAYGEEGEPTQHDVDRMARFVTRGGKVGFAATGGAIVAGAHLGRAIDRVAELAAVATDDKHRGLGIATALSAYLTDEALSTDADLVWLEPEGEAEQRMYVRVGYRAVGNKLYLSKR